MEQEQELEGGEGTADINIVDNHNVDHGINEYRDDQQITSLEDLNNDQKVLEDIEGLIVNNESEDQQNARGKQNQEMFQQNSLENDLSLEMQNQQVSQQENRDLEVLRMVRKLGLREKEVYDQFMLNEDRLKELMSRRESMRLVVGDLVVFKDKAEDILGAELDKFIVFFVEKVNLRTCKYSITFCELKTIFIQWLYFTYEERNQETLQEEPDKQNQEEQQKDIVSREKYEWRKKMSMGMLKFKLDKHQDKIVELLSRYSEQGRGEGTMTISKIPSILDDIAYIGGTVFCKQSEFEQTNGYVGQKTSSASFKEAFTKYLWKYIDMKSKVVNRKEESDLVKLQVKPVLKDISSPEGYYDDRLPQGTKVRYDDEVYMGMREQTLVDFQVMRVALKGYVKEKAVVVVDLTGDYAEQEKSVGKGEEAAVDLTAYFEKTIAEYEQLMQKTDEEQQRQKIEKVLDQLKKELYLIESANYNNNNLTDFALTVFGSNQAQDMSMAAGKNNNTEDEKETAQMAQRNKALHEIFNFYSRQHILNHDRLFQEFEVNMNRVDLGDFLKFCKDFDIQSAFGLNRNQVMHIFKKSSKHHVPLDYSQFLHAMSKIADEIKNTSREEQKKKTKEAGKSLHAEQTLFKAREEQHQNYIVMATSAAAKLSDSERKQMKSKIKQAKEHLKEMEQVLAAIQIKSNEQWLEDLYLFMHLDDLTECRKKIKGFHLAFNIRGQSQRMPEDDLGNKYKVRHKKIPFSDVKKMVQEIRDKREKDKNDKMLAANEKYFSKMKYIQKTHDKLRQEKLQKIIEDRKKNESEGKGSDRGSNKSRDHLLPNQSPFSYLEIKNSKQGVPPNDGRNLKVTLDIITKMHFQDFNSVGDKKQIFDPMALVNQRNTTSYSDEDINADGGGDFFNGNGDQDQDNDVNDVEVDDFTKKRMPKMEDFILDKGALLKAQQKAKKQKKLVNDYSEKILSLKNSIAVPQNHLILDQNMMKQQQQSQQQPFSKYTQGNPNINVNVNMNNMVSKSMANINNNQSKQMQGYDNNNIQGNQQIMKQLNVYNPKASGQLSNIGRYEAFIPQSTKNGSHLSKDSIGGGGSQVLLGNNKGMNRNASQNIIKMGQLELKNKDKMEGILKMHDRQIQKGMNVLRK